MLHFDRLCSKVPSEVSKPREASHFIVDLKPMEPLRLTQLLAKGDRKSLGAANRVAAALRKGEIKPNVLFKVLEASAFEHAVVSHGMHALSTVAQEDAHLAKKTIAWLFPRLDQFEQWEARSHFCRILIAHPPKLKDELWSTLKTLHAEKSAIVATYALEAMVVLGAQDPERAKSIRKLIKKALVHEKAAVRARARALAARRNEKPF